MGKSKWVVFRSEIEKIISDGNYEISPKAEAIALCDRHGVQYSESLRNYISRLQQSLISKGKKKAVKSDEPKKFVPSAWNDKGFMMDIDQYCEHYSLPRNDIKSYKLVSHTGTPYYNILFKDVVQVNDDSILDVIEARISSKKNSHLAIDHTKYEVIDRLIWTDVHVAMDSDPDNKSLYGHKWNESILLDSVDAMCAFMLADKKSDVLYVTDLGDFLDGANAQTVRGGHGLPQNMTNEQAFDTALKAKLRVADILCDRYDKVVFDNVCEDNHSGWFGAILNAAFKLVCEERHKNAEVRNHKKFMSWFKIGRHAFVITHGKDSRNLKFGFKPSLDTTQIEKIDQYLKQEGIYKVADFIQFDKGDSHQALFDFCGSDDFDYINYAAFSPSSDWVQTNFKKGRRGFAVQHIYPDINRKPIEHVWF